MVSGAPGALEFSRAVPARKRSVGRSMELLLPVSDLRRRLAEAHGRACEGLRSASPRPRAPDEQLIRSADSPEQAIKDGAATQAGSDGSGTSAAGALQGDRAHHRSSRRGDEGSSHYAGPDTVMSAREHLQPARRPPGHGEHTLRESGCSSRCLAGIHGGRENRDGASGGSFISGSTRTPHRCEVLCSSRRRRLTRVRAAAHALVSSCSAASSGGSRRESSGRRRLVGGSDCRHECPCVSWTSASNSVCGGWHVLLNCPSCGLIIAITRPETSLNTAALSGAEAAIGRLLCPIARGRRSCAARDGASAGRARAPAPVQIGSGDESCGGWASRSRG